MRASRPAGLLAALTLAGSALVACSAPPDPRPAADALAGALASGDLQGLVVQGGSAVAAEKSLASVTAGMAGTKRSVEVRGQEVDGDVATLRLAVTWDVDASTEDWTYQSSARLRYLDDQWQVVWSPSLLLPEGTADGQLMLRRTPAERGEILGRNDAVLVMARQVRRIGIDREKVAAADAASSARALAGLVGVDAEAFASRVAAAGERAFVEAITLRSQDAAPYLRRIEAIDGAVALAGSQPLPPTREFARPILGTVGAATAELVTESQGRIVAGDAVGLSGLQRRYDEHLGGLAGVRVELVPVFAVDAAPADATPVPTSTVTPSLPTGTPGPTSAAAPSAPSEELGPLVLYERPAAAGRPLVTTLDLRLQLLAEDVLADVSPASALVAIQASTGRVLAAASGPGGGGLSTATTGRYPPGSTFKVVSALALLRAGRTAQSLVDCPAAVTVDGKRFENYDDYPGSGIGRIPLGRALALSCNTAFINQRRVVNQDDLAAAAASLGLGQDYDIGLPAFFGSVPPAAGATEQAASLIGQGRVQASPLAMAAVAASVAAGRTVVPTLILDPPSPSGVDASAPADAVVPLTPAEGRSLRALMRGVVREGSARFLADVPGQPVGAKTGTAEFGAGDALRTHGWMIATQGDLAVAVFVQVAQSGSRTAGPLLEDFLRRR